MCWKVRVSKNKGWPFTLSILTILNFRTFSLRYPRLLAHTLELEFGLMVPRDCVESSPIKTSGATASYNVEEEPSYQWQSGREDFDRCVNSSSSHPFAQWICNGGIGRLSWAILAAQECQRTMYDIERDQIEKIVDANYKNVDWLSYLLWGIVRTYWSDTLFPFM